jgi:hypothetical protein
MLLSMRRITAMGDWRWRKVVCEEFFQIVGTYLNDMSLALQTKPA